jgi:hypothetical protein
MAGLQLVIEQDLVVPSAFGPSDTLVMVATWLLVLLEAQLSFTISSLAVLFIEYLAMTKMLMPSALLTNLHLTFSIPALMIPRSKFGTPEVWVTAVQLGPS